jgi:hypothetical protein
VGRIASEGAGAGSLDGFVQAKRFEVELVMIVWPALGVTLMLAQQGVPAPGITLKDEAALYFFMRSIARRPAHPRLPSFGFREDEIAKLSEVSRDLPFSQPSGKRTFRADSKHSPAIYTLNSPDRKPSEYLRARLGTALFLKVLTYCRRSVEPSMLSLPPPKAP